MSEASTGLTGGCLCGAVRFTAAPKDKDFGVCHCSMCRRWSAGPFFAMECSATVKVEDASNLGVYRSSEWAERCFCKVCGTALFYRLVGKDFYAVSVEAFDDRSGFALSSQVFIDEKPSYYDFANKTSNMTGAELFAAFGAPPPGSQAKD
jgi:hypothetical protein